MENETHSSQVSMIWPVLIRLSLFMIGPIVAYSFHKLAHFGIHLSMHKVERLKKLGERWKYLPDALMIVALVILHFVS